MLAVRVVMLAVLCVDEAATGLEKAAASSTTVWPFVAMFASVVWVFQHVSVEEEEHIHALLQDDE